MASTPPSVAPNSPVRDRTTGSVNGMAKLDANYGLAIICPSPRQSAVLYNCCCALALTLDVPIVVVLLAA